MTAGVLQSKISAWCEKQKLYTNKIISSSKNGLPDVLVVVDGVTYWFEIKFGKDKLSEIQKHTLSKLNEHKQIAFEVKTMEEFLNIMEEIRRRNASKM